MGTAYEKDAVFRKVVNTIVNNGIAYQSRKCWAKFITDCIHQEHHRVEQIVKDLKRSYRKLDKSNQYFYRTGARDALNDLLRKLKEAR